MCNFYRTVFFSFCKHTKEKDISNSRSQFSFQLASLAIYDLFKVSAVIMTRTTQIFWMFFCQTMPNNFNLIFLNAFKFEISVAILNLGNMSWYNAAKSVVILWPVLYLYLDTATVLPMIFVLALCGPLTSMLFFNMNMQTHNQTNPSSI